MPRFRDLPIRTKLMTGFMLTSLVALFLTVATLAFYDRTTFRKEMLRDVDTLAMIIGKNASSSIAFNDHQGATAMLLALKAQPHIIDGALYDSNGQLFAAYARPNAATSPTGAPRDGAQIGDDIIAVAQPVTFNGARVGTVLVRSDLNELVERRTRFLELAVVVFAGAALVALLMSSVFQRAISRPILGLLAIEKRVSREKDYSLKAEKTANDEVGLLIDGFNEMLGEIRVRDADIQERHRKEMALARTIQTSVLPRSFDLPGYDISAIMMPAEEVGGDFYEFRRTNGGAWIGVGDVTGHGVTSGLIMMMAQSMFTMLCEQGDGHVTPARFLTLLNRAMFYNLKARLAQDKFMTMVVARIEDGHMVFAGAHTDLLIFRAKTARIERIPTDGLWLGVTEDIEPMTANRDVALDRGDVALFHTDGVTEARNQAGECFDVDRLTAQLLRLHREPASTIVTSIAQAAWNWAGTPKDDVSLMAIKRS